MAIGDSFVHFYLDLSPPRIIVLIQTNLFLRFPRDAILSLSLSLRRKRQRIIVVCMCRVFLVVVVSLDDDLRSGACIVIEDARRFDSGFFYADLLRHLSRGKEITTRVIRARSRTRKNHHHHHHHHEKSVGRRRERRRRRRRRRTPPPRNNTKKGREIFLCLKLKTLNKRLTFFPLL